MAEKTDQGFYERFKKPIVLVKFVNCTDGVNKTNCTTIEVKELYANITKRLEKEPWCVNALNLDGLVSTLHREFCGFSFCFWFSSNFKTHRIFITKNWFGFFPLQFLKRLLAQPTISTTNETSNSSATGNGTESSATEQIVTSTEASATTGYVPSRENVEEEDRKPADEVQPKNNDSSESSETTVPLIVPAITVTSKPTSTTTADVTTHTTTSKPESTTKSKPTKKKKIVEDHHYHGSITIIAIIVGVLLTVLIVLAVVVRILIARRKNFHPRTSSTTYVFESHQYWSWFKLIRKHLHLIQWTKSNMFLLKFVKICYVMMKKRIRKTKKSNNRA